jgi:aarF domain-containing kinase
MAEIVIQFGAVMAKQQNSILGNIKDVLQGGARIGKTAQVLGFTGFNWLRGNRPPPARLVRQTFEELGATYIKLGQFIASSPSLFPSDYVREFENCLDSVESLPFSVIKKTVEKELGHPLTEVYASVDEQPLASASIAQVHAARLLTGEDVVIKVQKPGVQTVLLTDFNFLYVASKIIELFVPATKRAVMSDIVADIQATMLEECDFVQEAKNIEMFDAFLKRTNNVMSAVPKVYWEATSTRVLTMERFYGAPVTDLEAIRKYSDHPDMTLAMALNTWFSSLVECQFFHADLHAGNMMILQDGRIGFIDFGIVGHIRGESWQAMVKFIEAQQSMDYQTMAESMVVIGATGDDVDPKVLARDLRNLIEGVDSIDPVGMMEGKVNEKEVNDMMMSIVGIGKRHGIKFPREFALLVKQFLYFDRYVDLLAPGMSMFGDDRIQMIQ